MDFLAFIDKAGQHHILQDIFLICWVAFGIGVILHGWLQRQLPSTQWQQVGKVPIYQMRATDVLGAFMLTLPYCLPLLLPYHDKDTSVPASNATLATSFIILLIAATVVIAIFHKRGQLVESLGLLPTNPAKIITFAVIGFIAIYVIAALLNALGLEDWLGARLGERKNQDIVNYMLNGGDPARITIMVIGACIVAPLAEEIIFRGYLYPAMKRFTGPYLAAVVTGIIFGVMHGEIWVVVPLSLFGIILAALYEWSGSIYTCILTHCIFNSVNTTLMLNPHLMQQAQ